MMEAVKLWNEPNNKSHWDPLVDPEWDLFVEMTLQAGAAVKAVNPDLVRVLGGLSPIDPGFLQRLEAKGLMAAIDAVAVHGFPLDWNLWPIDEWPVRVAEIRAVTDKPVWITEVGVSSFGSEEVQAWGVKKTADLLLGQAPRIFWYSLYDLPMAWEATTRHREAEGSSYYRHFHMGLLREDGAPKPALDVFRPYASRMGLCQWFHFQDHRLDEAVSWMRELGVRHVRTGLSWADRFRDGALDWFDRQMEALSEFDTTITFCFTPEHCGIEPHHTSAPIDPSAYAEFCAEMVERYAPRRLPIAAGTGGGRFDLASRHPAAQVERLRERPLSAPPGRVQPSSACSAENVGMTEQGARAVPGRPTPDISVLTLHRCINYGSYWQARCLVDGLTRLGWRPILLDPRSRRIDRLEWTHALAPDAGSPRPLHIGAYRRKIRAFFRAQQTLPIGAPFAIDAPERAGKFDAVIIGSDEVWNFRHPWYAALPVYFGEGLRARRLVAYAASFGSHDAIHGLGESWSRRLKGFSAISVRDGNSRALTAMAVGDAPALTLDPCLQFQGPATAASDSGDHLLIYGQDFSKKFIAEITAWARRHGRRIVSLGYENSWADVQILDAGPEEFRIAMGEAAAVATNFFHGCVFALINRRPFVAALTPYRANKVADLAHRLGFTDRLMSQGAAAADYDRALLEPPDLESNGRLTDLRAASDQFLRTALGTPQRPA